MDNKNLDNKRSLNNKIINAITVILYISIICAIVVSVVGWIKTNDWVFIIFGPISVLGFLFNIYLLSKSKSK